MEEEKKLKIKAGSQNPDPLSIQYCVNRNKDAFCYLWDSVSRSLIKTRTIFYNSKGEKCPLKI